MHDANGGTVPSYVYPIKYLCEPLLPYESYFDNTF